MSDLEYYYSFFEKGNTYNICIINNIQYNDGRVVENNINIGDFVFNRFDTYSNPHFFNKGNNTFIEFDNLSIRLDEISKYKIILIKESEYYNIEKLIIGQKYLIGESKEKAKYYTVVSKYSEGYYMLNHETNKLQKFMYVSFVNYKVFRDV